MTALMSAAVRAGAGVVLIQEPSMRQEEEGWKAKIRDSNYIYIHSSGNDRPYVLTAIQKDLKWNHYGGTRMAERVGIEIAGTLLMNIYHHRERVLDVRCITDELEGCNGKKWVCAGDFNCHHSVWDGKAREPAGSWREVTELIELGQLMIEPGTPTWRGGQNHRSSTIDLVIVSNAAAVSMAEIATDLYTGSDHETLCWEIGNCSAEENRRVQTPRWKIPKPIKNDDIDEEEEWRNEWRRRTQHTEDAVRNSPLELIPLFKSFLDDIFGRTRWSPRAKRWWRTEHEEERDILGEARRTTPPSSDQFKQARNRWLRAIRKAKRECWERFLQASDPGAVWKSINARPQACAMPPILTSPSGEQYTTKEEKMEAIANISLPTKPDYNDNTTQTVSGSVRKTRIYATKTDFRSSQNY
jgi:hypothetical protein